MYYEFMFDVNRKKTVFLIIAGLLILFVILQMQRQRMAQLDIFEDPQPPSDNRPQVLEELQKKQAPNSQNIPTH